MADKTIDSEAFYLLDKWPGEPWMGGDIPTDGFTGTSHHNVSTAAYPVGTKIQVMNTHTDYEYGPSTLIYLRVLIIDNTTDGIQHKHFVTCQNTTNWWAVGNCDGSHLVDLSEPAAVCVGLMSTTTGYYGWFWCGGVCPTQYVTNLDGNFATDSTAVAGPNVLSVLTATTTTYGTLGLQAMTTSTGMFPVAFLLKNDAA